MNMGEPFYGTGKPPEGYKPGDYVEIRHLDDWIEFRHVWPKWYATRQYRLPADHPFYRPPVWCLDKAAQLAGHGSWAALQAQPTLAAILRKSIIAHARTLRDGCEPMQEPVDPLEAALMQFCEERGEASFQQIAAELRARFDITPKGEAK